MDATAAAEPDRQTDPPRPEPAPVLSAADPKLILLSAQFLLLLLAVLYAAGEIVMPVVLALLLKLLLEPVMRLLDRLRLPRLLAALLVILAVFGTIIAVGAALSGPAQAWAAKLPTGIPRLQQRLSLLAQPIDTLRRFLDSAGASAHSAGGAAAPASGPGLSETVFVGTAHFAGGFFTMILLLFFLLVSGDTFLRRLVEILPRFRDKRQAVAITQQIESEISGYLFTITMMNLAVGAATAVAMWAAGVENPILWGTLAFLLNYVPILGPIVCLGVLLLVGLLSFDTLGRALLPVGMYFIIHLIEGEAITPMLVARRFTLNPVVVIVSLIFWHWMWGVPGAILAVPMLAMLKIVCDEIRPWAPLGHLIEG